jgi:hypothetical protein
MEYNLLRIGLTVLFPVFSSPSGTFLGGNSFGGREIKKEVRATPGVVYNFPPPVGGPRPPQRGGGRTRGGELKIKGTKLRFGHLGTQLRGLRNP